MSKSELNLQDIYNEFRANVPSTPNVKRALVLKSGRQTSLSLNGLAYKALFVIAAGLALTMGKMTLTALMEPSRSECAQVRNWYAQNWGGPTHPDTQRMVNKVQPRENLFVAHR